MTSGSPTPFKPMNECVICHKEIDWDGDFCETCDARVIAVIKADLARRNVEETEKLRRSVQEGTFKDQGDGFYK